MMKHFSSAYFMKQIILILLSFLPTFIYPQTADEWANRVMNAMGGKLAWAAVERIEFSFFGERNGVSRPPILHNWNRKSQDYTLQWQRGDSTIVVDFNVGTQAGKVRINEVVQPESSSGIWLKMAYGRYINDTYWLLMPTKLFDEGVNRSLAPDSSNATHQALKLDFGNVGLTPGDQYWLFINKETGFIDRWSYRLQSGGTGNWLWTDYKAFETATGQVFVAEKHVSGNSVLWTKVSKIE